MTRSNFDVYGAIAQGDIDPTLQKGRYLLQQEAERLNVPDVIAKLAPRPGDTLLDIGCGMGTVLLPLSAMVADAVGVDHPAVTAKLRAAHPGGRFRLIGGSIFDVDPGGPFTLVVAYNVLQTMFDFSGAIAFVDRALDCLALEGRMLLADIPNVDRKARFQKSQRGQKFERAWAERARHAPGAVTSPLSGVARAPLTWTDEHLLNLIRHIRSRGFHASLATQPQGLPFGNSREDILVHGPEYDDGTSNF